MQILSEGYSKLVVKEVIEGKESILLEITDDPNTPVISRGDIKVHLIPKE